MDIKEKIAALYAEWDEIENEEIALKLRKDELSAVMDAVFRGGLSERLKAMVLRECELFQAEVTGSLGQYILAKEAYNKAKQEVEDFKNYFR